PGEGALADLGTGDADDHGVVGPDHDPGVDFRRAVGRPHDGRAAKRKIEAEREPAADRGGADHERAAIDLRNVIHVRLPYALAAAAGFAPRACGRVPKGKVWVISALVSAWVGLGLSLSGAATAMIMPLWQ